MSPKLFVRDNTKFHKRSKKSRKSNVIFKKEDSTQFCLSELNEVLKICLDNNPVYNWSDRNNGGFWKRTWELMIWGINKNKSGSLVQCYRNSIKDFKNCVGSDVSAKTKIFDYNDAWLIHHKIGNCSGIVVPKTKAKKILGCDGKTQGNIVNPRYNVSKGKVMNCNTDLPDNQWCSCPGYPVPNSESTYDPKQFRCVCNNPAKVPHYHYIHNVKGSDGRIITCCGSTCDYGYEYDCIERKCKRSLYSFED